MRLFPHFLFAIVLVACSSSSSTSTPDGAPPGKADARTPSEAGSTRDASPRLDTGTVERDTGVPDAGGSTDTGAKDGGTPHFDAGVHEDAGTDAGADAHAPDSGTDAGMPFDAGIPMNCQVPQDCMAPATACITVACVGSPGICQYSYAPEGTSCGTGSTCDSQGHCQ